MSAVIDTASSAQPSPAGGKGGDTAGKGRTRLNPKYLPLTATISLFLLVATLGSVFYDGFFSAQVFLNLLIDNAFLIVVAVGMTFVILSGYGLHAVGLELDAIAAVVIGGTLLTGGVGYVAGTLVGVLILGLIQTAITFEGTLSSWWTRIAMGGLLLGFILLQRGLQRAGRSRA